LRDLLPRRLGDELVKQVRHAGQDVLAICHVVERGELLRWAIANVGRPVTLPDENTQRQLKADAGVILHELSAVAATLRRLCLVVSVASSSIVSLGVRAGSSMRPRFMSAGTPYEKPSHAAAA